VLALDADTSASDIASPFKLVANFELYRNYANVAGYNKIQILHITAIYQISSTNTESYFHGRDYNDEVIRQGGRSS
jgi:hypothetical protein